MFNFFRFPSSPLIANIKPQKVSWNTHKLVPQYLDRPVAEDRFRYKASTGSYKAADFLLKLLEFTASATIDGNPWNDILASELEDLLRQRLPDRHYSEDPITVASRSAWPKSENGRVIVVARDIRFAAEHLCEIIQKEPHANIVSRLILAHNRKEAEAPDYEDLGLNFEPSEYNDPPLRTAPALKTSKLLSKF